MFNLHLREIRSSLQAKNLAYLVGLVLLLANIGQGKTGDVLMAGFTKSGRPMEKVEWLGTEKGYIVITYPKGFKKSQPYNLNFWFPGTGGNPSFGIADENENYIEICASYLAQKLFLEGEYAKKHWQLCQEFEKMLIKRKQIAVGQRIFSGVSKGGWLAFQMTVEPPKGLDGVVIVAAGQYPGETRTSTTLQNSQLAVLVCTGETDTNYPFAQMAEAYYKKYKLKDYCYEEWLTKGHISDVSPRVNEWLNIQAKKGVSKQALQVFSDALATKKLNEVDKLDTPERKYIALRHLIKSPSYRHINIKLREKILKKGQELNKDKTVISWRKDYNILRKIVQNEADIYHNNAATSQQVAKIKALFVKLAKQTKYNTLKVRSAYGYLRTTKNHARLKLKEQEKAKPEYQKMVNNLNNLLRRIKRDKRPAPLLVTKYQELARDIGDVSAKLAMKAFLKVEQNKKYTINDIEIKKILEKKQETLSPYKPYSGLFY